MKHTRSAWQIQKAVIFALLMRELRTRFGTYRLGYVWALLEPLSHVIVLALIFGYFLHRTLPGINYTVFFIAGIMPWLLFNNMLNRGMAAVTANRALFNYRQIKPMDTVVARMLLEGMINLASYTFLLTAVIWLGIEVEISDPLKLLGALVLLYVLSFGLALLLCVVSTLYPEAGKFIPLILKPLYFISGIFFTLEMIPPEFHIYFTWNPILHTIELSRDALFSAYHTPGGNFLYLGFLAIVILAVGMAVYRQNSVRMVTT